MSTVATHTKLPWRMIDYPAIDPAMGRTVIAAENGGELAEVHGPKLANAQFIVRACNCHYELLEACKTLWGLIENGTLVRDISRDTSPDWSKLMLDFTMTLNKVRAAIEHATGGQP